jgi:hypothetical protein
MRKEHLLLCSDMLANIMLEVYEEDWMFPIWTSDLSMGCAIGATVLFRYLVEERKGSPVLVMGQYRGLGHSFVLARCEGRWFVADPTFMQFEDAKRVNVRPFGKPIRNGAEHCGYRIERYTSVPSRISDLFHDWGEQSPVGQWRPLLSRLRCRMREVDDKPQDPNGRTTSLKESV